MVANTGISKRYHRHERIGEGGMGEIFRAQDTQTGEDVALKVLKGQPSAESMQRFAREGQALRQLDHPNIVKFLDAFEDDGQQVLVLEYVPGGSLRQLLSQQGPLGVEQTLRISLELADALSRAHLLHIIHRDIKPANILLAADGTPRLTDFGIAYMADSPRMTDTGATVGTIGYLSPEACRGETLGPAADIWSFGIVLWEMLTGQTPFEGRSIAATLNAVLSAPLPDITRLRDDLPPGLVRLLMHMLDKDPAQRLNSTRQVGANIETLLAGDDPTLHLERHQTPQPRSSTTQPALDLPRHNLPAQTTPFIGRETELATVAAQLGETRLLTLVGPGGMGKTRLALVAAEQAIDHYADGVYFVALAPLSLPDNIISAIADAIGYEFYGALAPNQQLQDYLREKKMMLVMDNFEHLIQAAPLMGDLLRAAPGLKLLVTSRERLNIRGESILMLEGLKTPDYLSPEELQTFGAVQLFIQSAQRANPNFQLTNDNRDAVVAICQRVYGVPLGIELAAGWVEVLSVEEILAEVEASLDFLETDMRDVPERHRSIRAVFDYSWHLLSDAERATFARLSVFRGGFTREAAQEIADANLRALTGLANKSLVRRLPSGRYEIHELLRQYAASALDAQPDIRDETLARHCQYYMVLLDDEERFFSDEAPATMAIIDMELDNVRCAVEWATRHKRGDLLEKVQYTLYMYKEIRSFYDEAQAIYAHIGDAFADDPAYIALYIVARTNEAMARLRMGQFQEARDRLLEAVALCNQPERQVARSWAMNWLAYAEIALGDYDKAEAYAREAYELQNTPATPNWMRGSVMSNLSYILFLRGELEAARDMSAQAVAMSMQRNHPFTIAYLRNNHGEILRSLGDVRAARALFEESYAMFEQINYRRGMAFVANNLGGLLQTMGRYDEARKLYNRSYRLHTEVGDRIGIGHSLSALGSIALFTGDPSTAEGYFSKSLALRRELNDLRGIGDSLEDLGRTKFYLQEYDDADVLLEQALVVRRQMGDPQREVSVLTSLGENAMYREDYQAARDYLQTALERTTAPDSLLEAGFIQANLTTIDLQEGQLDNIETTMQGLVEMVRRTNLEWPLVWHDALMGFYWLDKGDIAKAEESIFHGVESLEHIRHPRMVGFVVSAMAGLLIAREDYEAALPLLLPLVRSQGVITYSIAAVRARHLFAQVQAQRPDLLPPAADDVQPDLSALAHAAQQHYNRLYRTNSA